MLLFFAFTVCVVTLHLIVLTHIHCEYYTRFRYSIRHGVGSTPRFAVKQLTRPIGRIDSNIVFYEDVFYCSPQSLEIGDAKGIPCVGHNREIREFH